MHKGDVVSTDKSDMQNSMHFTWTAVIKTYFCSQMTMSTSDENLVAENERLQLECINKDEEIVKVK